MMMGAPMGGVAVMAPLGSPATPVADNEVKIDFETSMFCGGPDIPYGRDNRLGEHIDHAGISQGCRELADAYNFTVGARKYCIAVPCIVFPLIVLIMVLNFSGVFEGGGTTTTECFPFWECGDGSMPSVSVSDSGTKASDILIPVGAMFGGFAIMATAMCCMGMADHSGIQAMRHKCGELNGKLSPINFRLDSRLETQLHSTMGDGDGIGRHGRDVRIQTRRRWSLIITNTTMPAHAATPVAIAAAPMVMQPPTVVAPAATPIHLAGENNPDFTNGDAGPKFCPSCGSPCAGMKFCGKCGKNLQGKDMGF